MDKCVSDSFFSGTDKLWIRFSSPSLDQQMSRNLPNAIINWNVSEESDIIS